MRFRVFSNVVLAVAAVALSLIGTATLASPASAAGASAPTARKVSAKYEDQVLHFLNKRRAAHRLPALRKESCTDGYAERWGRFLATKDAFYHQSMQGLTAGCKAKWAGETLASGAVSARQIVSLWMHSPSHRAIMLSKDPRKVGIGAYRNASGAWVVAADYTRF